MAEGQTVRAEAAAAAGAAATDTERPAGAADVAAGAGRSASRAVPLLEAVRLCKSFPAGGSLLRRNRVVAVNDVSFALREGETYGLVGESGSGKSTTGRMLAGLTRPDSGEVRYAGQPSAALKGKAGRGVRRDIQFVFQDPYSSFDPKQRIGDALEEPLIIHRLGNAAERKEKAVAMLEAVGLRPDHLFRHPHELSGGQRQRLSLARALILDPKVILCDEPVSALDVSIQSQILNMLKQLQRELGLTMLFITHDMSVVRYISDRIGVMYLGTLVEEAASDDLFRNPQHPYTKALLSAVPDLARGRLRERIELRGEVSGGRPPAGGCAFYSRCPFAVDLCRVTPPVLREGKTGHKVACHLSEGMENKR